MGRERSRADLVMPRLVLCAAAAALIVAAPPAVAQPRGMALDAVASADADGGSTVRREPGVWFDIFGAVRLWEGLEVVARPVFARRTFDGAWSKQIYQLG